MKHPKKTIIPPRPTGKPPVVVHVTGYLSPGAGPGIAVLPFPNLLSPNKYVFVFSSKEKLETFCQGYGFEYERIKQVTNHDEFLEDAEHLGVRVAIDPHWDIVANKWKWLEIGGAS